MPDQFPPHIEPIAGDPAELLVKWGFSPSAEEIADIVEGLENNHITLADALQALHEQEMRRKGEALDDETRRPSPFKNLPGFKTAASEVE